MTENHNYAKLLKVAKVTLRNKITFINDVVN